MSDDDGDAPFVSASVPQVVTPRCEGLYNIEVMYMKGTDANECLM